jgi:superfamily II DNA/RNA helicase
LTVHVGRPEAVVVIHGGIGREERRKAQERFTQGKGVEVLVATDAAGEGINLQRAHLMVNCDLPWNPSRLEQRFGRIHRIGQTEALGELRFEDRPLRELLLEAIRYGDRPEVRARLGQVVEKALDRTKIRELRDAQRGTDGAEQGRRLHPGGGGDRGGAGGAVGVRAEAVHARAGLRGDEHQLRAEGFAGTGGAAVVS